MTQSKFTQKVGKENNHMTIRKDIAVLHALKADHKTSVPALTAINDGISALMTIEDMSFYGIPPVKKEPATAGIDLKTLYEQTTMYCELVDIDKTVKYDVEIFHQLETPIYVFVYWNREPRTIHSIAYTIKGE